MLKVGIDLGGTNIKIGLVDDGKVLKREIIEGNCQNGLASRLPEIEKKIRFITDQKPVDMIGLAFPGIVTSSKVISVNNKYDDALEIDLVDWSRTRLGAALTLENDARAACIGEWKFGAGKGCDNLVMVTLGTGIGSSAIIEGKILRGVHYQAGILGGHFVVRSDKFASPCSCGGIGCVEAEASTWRLPSLIKTDPLFESSSLKNKEKLDFKVLFEHARNGDVLAKKIRDYSISIWSKGIINLVHAYDAELVILMGGIMKSSNDILPAIKEQVKRFAWCPWGDLKILESTLGDDAAILGVTSL